MIRNHFLLLRRLLWKNKGFTLLNLFGLAIGFAGFILSYQYINKERSYDLWNPNAAHIYLVGLSYQGQNTNQTPPSLAPLLEQEFPEITLAGRIMPYPYGTYPIFGKETAVAKQAILADASAAKLFRVKTQDGQLWELPPGAEGSIVNSAMAAVLFHPDSIPTSERPISLQSLSTQQGFFESMYGIAQERPPSILQYDLLLVKRIQDEVESGNPFTFQTFIQVSPRADIAALTDKINQLYTTRVAKHEVVQRTAFAKGSVYLDPLTNLHLAPKHGSNMPLITLWVLGLLSTIILILAAINFTNLILAQADQRAKEIGMKKLFGSSRSQMAVLFFAEVALQCFLAACLAWSLLYIGKDPLQHWLNEDLGNYLVQRKIVEQLGLAALLTTCMAGIYPALTLSFPRPIQLLQGKMALGTKKSTIRSAFLTFQCVMALVFVTGGLVIHSQLKWMRSEERGFEPSQVIQFKGMGMYYPLDHEWKIDYRNRLLASGLFSHVSTTTNSPGDLQTPPSLQFTYQNEIFEMEQVGVDLDYFDLLSIATVQGRNGLTEVEFLKDSLQHYAVINQRAAETLGLKEVIGATIKGCDTEFKVIGVVADSKVAGFEKQISPTLYTFKHACSGRYHLDILVKTMPGKTQEAIDWMNKEWVKNKNADRLPLDYVYLDQNYERLNERQQHLQEVIGGFVVLTLLIAGIGMFGLSAYYLALRRKEIGIRMVLGASKKGLLFELNKTFLGVFVLANLIAIPISFMVSQKWLQQFAYSIELTIWPFVGSGLSLLLILLGTVAYQSFKASQENPVESLRDQ
jgi:putative ABC transport system permease protein